MSATYTTFLHKDHSAGERGWWSGTEARKIVPGRNKIPPETPPEPGTYCERFVHGVITEWCRHSMVSEQRRAPLS